MRIDIDDKRLWENMIWNEKCIISRALQRGMLTWAKRKLVIPFAVYTTYGVIKWYINHTIIL